MSTVIMHSVVSVDGFIADEKDEVGPLFDITNGWEGTPPTGDHVVVVSHRGRPAGWHPEASDANPVIQGDRVLHLRYRVKSQA